jgi:two-component system sensor histidine kinase/response regulator
MVFSISLSAEDKLVFTEEEKQWINDHPVIKVGIDKNQKPIEFMHDKNPQGIGWDYLSYISKISGLTFKSVVQDDIKVSMQSLKDNKVDLVSAIFSEYKIDNVVYSGSS